MKKGKVVWLLNIIIISIKNKNVDRYLLHHIDKWGKDINPMLENIYLNRNILKELSFPVINMFCQQNIDNRNIFILDSSDKLNIKEYQRYLSNDYNYYLIYSPTEEKSILSRINASIFEAIGKITYNKNLFCSKKNHFWEMAGNKI